MKEGWLEKKTKSFWVFRRRWFILTSSAELLYFHDQPDKNSTYAAGFGLVNPKNGWIASLHRKAEILTISFGDTQLQLKGDCDEIIQWHAALLDQMSKAMKKRSSQQPKRIFLNPQNLFTTPSKLPLQAHFH